MTERLGRAGLDLPAATPKDAKVEARSQDTPCQVAEAAGGFLGLTSKASASQQAALDEMARLLAG